MAEPLKLKSRLQKAWEIVLIPLNYFSINNISFSFLGGHGYRAGVVSAFLLYKIICEAFHGGMNSSYKLDKCILSLSVLFSIPICKCPWIVLELGIYPFHITAALNFKFCKPISLFCHSWCSKNQFHQNRL